MGLHITTHCYMWVKATALPLEEIARRGSVFPRLLRHP
jgi:hypothetical protein